MSRSGCAEDFIHLFKPLKMHKIYISDVIQSKEHHLHDFTIEHSTKNETAIYSDNSSQQVVKWADEKQQQLRQDEKLDIGNYFNI